MEIVPEELDQKILMEGEVGMDDPIRKKSEEHMKKWAKDFTKRVEIVNEFYTEKFESLAK